MKRKAVRRLTLAALVATCGALTPVAGAQRSDRPRSVLLEDIAFSPRTARIERGARITWRWRDEATPHNVVSRGRRFRSSSTKESGTHTVRFRRAGTYRYVCTIHPGMTGRVVVR